MTRLRRWWWVLLLIPVIIGATRLRFDVEILNLLPQHLPAVQGLKTFQENFSNARVRFVLPRGRYVVDGARLEQAVESDDAHFTVLTARFDLLAMTSGRITVRAAE